MKLTATLAFFFAALTGLVAEPVRVRVVAANLSSGTQQSYSVDNGNHSNVEGAGARILKGLKPDVVLIQEFNTSMNPRQWVNATFGEEYQFSKEEGAGIPNGVISRFPIIGQGEWDDPTQTNRDFAWAKIRLPNGQVLWAISVHLKAGGSGGDQRTRVTQAETLVAKIREHIPAEDLVVLGGDFNTSNRRDGCIRILAQVLETGEPHPHDTLGDEDTNANRNKPYDWVVTDADLKAKQVPVQTGQHSLAPGLVVDTRTYEPLADLAPAQAGDSGVTGMQHMAVVKDFVVK